VTEPRWIEIARSLVDQVRDGESILPLATKIGKLYPEMSGYMRMVGPNTPWCGLFVAYCLAVAGIRPIYTDDDNELNDALWANGWEWFGMAVTDQPQVGDIVVFDRHVGFYVGETSDSYRILGGNQSDEVNIKLFRKEAIRAVRRPPELQKDAMPSRFDACLPTTLKWEGGNDDDSRDPGGRTSRGILQSEWNTWRQSHPGLPADVWQAPQDQIVAIYRQHYWDRMRCDEMPPGVDLAVFDFGVNSGRGVRRVQQVLDVDQDGEVGPVTLGAINGRDPTELINAICDNRMAYLRGLDNWPTFGRGWTNRVADVRATALAMVGAVEPTPPELEEPPMPETPSSDMPKIDIRIMLDFILKNPGTVAVLAAFIEALRTGRVVIIDGPAMKSAAPPINAVPPKPAAAIPPSVKLSAAALGAGTIAQTADLVGTPFGFGNDPTLAGSLVTLVPIVTGVVGALGGWGGLAAVAGKVLSALAAAAPKA
jgi:uncharacterized protein (TIGR02594 family)